MKKKLIIGSMITIGLAFSASLFAQGIEFTHGTWAEVKAKAKEEHKLIFVDFYTDWCMPCKMMAKEVFPRPEVGDFYNKHFISVQIDAEKGEGIDLAKKYRVGAYPTLVFTNPDEKVVYQIIGSAKPAVLIEQAGIALNPASDYVLLKEKYAKNELNKTEFTRYLNMVQATGADKETEKVFDAYFDKWPEVSAAMFESISTYVNTPGSKAFQYLETHRDAFSAIAGKEAVDNYARRIYLGDFRYRKYADEAAYRQAKEELKKKISIDEKQDLDLDVNYFIMARDEKNYIKYAGLQYEKYFHDDARQIGNIVGPCLRFVKDESLMAIVKQWAERAVYLQNNALNNAQLALVYVRQKNMPVAEKYFDISLAASKRDNDGLYEKIDAIRTAAREGKF